MFCHSFISDIRDMFRPKISAIVRRHYKNIKGKTNRTKKEASSLVLLGRFLSSISFTFYIFVGTPDDGRNYLPKHVTYMRNKWMSEHSCCCIGLITIEDSDCDTVCGGVMLCSVIEVYVRFGETCWNYELFLWTW